MLKIKYLKHNLNFLFKAGTSRGVLTERITYILKIYHENSPNLFGLGEASPLKGLSIDYIPDFEQKIERFCQDFNASKFENITYQDVKDKVHGFPALQFALETAILDLKNCGKRWIYPNAFVLQNQPLPINGLIWMGTEAFMQQQIEAKLKAGFSCIKMKIGALDFDTEFRLLKKIRQKYNAQQITLRVDANGAFSVREAEEKLRKLSELQLHSIEQPIRPKQVSALKKLCKHTPLPIALDEELIGVEVNQEGKYLLETINPQFIILKPTLLGGLQNTQKWIEYAEALNIGWWITSALESNIGLNAIAQFTAQYKITLPQGLGTGQLYSNNFKSPLSIEKGFIQYSKQKSWDLDQINTL